MYSEDRRKYKTFVEQHMYYLLWTHSDLYLMEGVLKMVGNITKSSYMECW